jgi:hypothetical protein
MRDKTSTLLVADLEDVLKKTTGNSSFILLSRTILKNFIKRAEMFEFDAQASENATPRTDLIHELKDISDIVGIDDIIGKVKAGIYD